MVPPSKPRIEELLAHATWVRELARRLAANSGDGDDLAQETWVAALSNPPRTNENLRGWLTRVLQNFAFRSRRAETRRSHLEREASRPEAQPSVVELHERAQVHRELIEAVLDLEEPYGSTVLMRFFEGLPPRIIAARQGVPVNTVRTRLSRGLATLRSRLNQTQGDERGPVSILLPLTADPYLKTHLGLGALLMNTQAKIACTVLVVGIAGTVLWRIRGAEFSTPPDGPLAVVDSHVLERPLSGSERVRPALDPVLQDPGEPQDRTLVVQAKRDDTTPARVSGRLLLGSGDPAAGARLVLRRQAGDEDSDPQSHWVDLTVDADNEGRFEFAFLPPRVHRLEAFALGADYPGHVPLAWTMILVQAGSRVDLGTESFAEPGRIAVRIIDREGEVLVDGWTVRAEATRRFQGARDSVRVWGVPDDATGVIELKLVPAGVVSVSANHRMGAMVQQVAVTVRAWEETPVTLFYDGPDLARRITVQIAVPRAAYGLLDGSMLRLEDGAGNARVPSRVERRMSVFTFDGLEPGLYTVRVEDPRFEPWSRASVRPGEYVEARLVGSAALRLLVVDAQTSEPVVGAELWGDLHDSSRSRTRFDLPPGVLQDDGSEIYAGLVPTSFSVVARAPGYPEARVAVEDLAAGEERLVTIPLRYTPPLVGRVVQSDGHTPAANVLVQRTPGPEPGWKLEGPVWNGPHKIPPIAEVVTTDEDGMFRFEGLSATPHALRAVQGRWLAVSRSVEWPADAGQELLLVLPPHGRLAGRILVPPGRSAAALVIRLDYPDHDDAARIGFLPENRVQGGELTAEGDFELGPLPIGAVRLWYKCAKFDQPSTGVSFELGEVTIRDGQTTHVEFDERERFPGRLRIRVTLDGERQVTGKVRVEAERNAASRKLDPRGEIVFEDARPGPWHVSYLEPGGRWSYRGLEAWMVRPGETTEVDLYIFLHERNVMFLDPASGSPLRQAEVGWRTEWPVPALGGARLNSIGGSAITDDEGCLTLEFPDGMVRFYRGVPAEGADLPYAEVSWTSDGTDLRVEVPDHP